MRIYKNLYRTKNINSSYLDNAAVSAEWPSFYIWNVTNLLNNQLQKSDTILSDTKNATTSGIQDVYPGI